MNTSDLLSGDVLLVSSRTWIGKLIRRLDGTDVTHAGIYLGNEQVGEALMAGNAGINSNPIRDAFEGCDWIQVHRLPGSTVHLQPIVQVASDYIDEGNRYAYAEILLLAAILLTRKVGLDDSTLGLIAFKVFQRANDWINELFDQGKEPMICSEFVFRCYDEADPADNDQFSLELLSQTGQRRRRFSRRRRRKQGLEAQPEADLATVHPSSLLAEVMKETSRYAAMAATPNAGSTSVTEAQIDSLIADYLGESPPSEVTTQDSSMDTAEPISQDDLKAEAARLIDKLATPDRAIFKGTPDAAARLEVRAAAVFADFVTPGDLLKSPSLETIERIIP